MRERGAALAVTIVLLSGLGALALTAAAAAVAALALAGHQQAALSAFEAAEAGIARALEAAHRSGASVRIEPTSYPGDGPAGATLSASTTAGAGAGPLPAGFSVGGHAGAFVARHHFIAAEGRAGRGATVRLEQGYYFVEPAAP